MTGFSEVIGSWKIIEISLPRMSRISASSSCTRSLPSILIEPADDASRRVGHQAQDRQRGHRLAAAGLADDRQCLAPPHRERDVVDRLDDAEPGEQIGLQPLDLEHRLGIVAGAQPRSAGMSAAVGRLRSLSHPKRSRLSSAELRLVISCRLE